MEKKRALGSKGLVVRATLAVAVTALSLSLAGCGKQMARIEKNQLRLQAMLEANAQQMAGLASRLEDNQGQLQAEINHVQNDARLVAADIAAVADAQMKLEEMIRKNNQTISGQLDLVQQNQHNVHVSIRDVQGVTQAMTSQLAAVGDGQVKLRDTMQRHSSELVDRAAAIEQSQQNMQAAFEGAHNDIQEIATGLTAIQSEQTKLQSTVKDTSQQIRDKVTLIDQNQQTYDGAIRNLQENVQAMAAEVEAVQQNLLRLHETLDSRVRDMMGIIDVVGQEQLKFEDGIQEDIRKLSVSANLIKQNQAKLDKQIENLHSSVRAINDYTVTTLDQLKADIRRRGPAETVETKPAVPDIK